MMCDGDARGHVHVVITRHAAVHIALAGTYPNGSVDLRVSWTTLDAARPAIKWVSLSFQGTRVVFYPFAQCAPAVIAWESSGTFAGCDRYVYVCAGPSLT